MPQGSSLIQLAFAVANATVGLPHSAQFSISELGYDNGTLGFYCLQLYFKAVRLGAKVSDVRRRTE